MFDICLCDGKTCNKKDTCLRYIYHLESNKEDNDTYFEESPIFNNDCSFYIEA